MKVVITGGHFSPALAVINELKKSADILVIGRKHVFEGDPALSYEYQVCAAHNIPFKALRAARLQRRWTRHTLPAFLKFPTGIKQAHAMLREYKPDVVLTFGGYIALPVAFAARILGIPIVVHEQTQNAGLSNKIISKFAEKVCISFRTSERFFPKSRTVYTGNPIREEIFTIDKIIRIPQGMKIIYITGGSSGSHFINETIAKILPELLKHFVVIHQTGESEYHDFEMLEKLKSSLPEELRERYKVKKFIYPDEIAWIYQSSSLVISRSGVNTVSELLALSRVGFLIPLPHGQHNEQLLNAEYFKKSGLGDYLTQDKVTPEIVLEKIKAMMQDIDSYKKSSDYVRDEESSVRKIVDILINTSKN